VLNGPRHFPCERCGLAGWPIAKLFGWCWLLGWVELAIGLVAELAELAFGLSGALAVIDAWFAGADWLLSWLLD
jgi:hypothetical protein